MRRHGPGHWRERRATRDRGYDQRPADFGMSSQATEPEGEDRREACRFPAQDEAQHRDRCIAMRLGSRENEDERHEKVEGEDETRFDRFEGHEAACHKTVEGVETLGRGEDIGFTECQYPIPGAKGFRSNLQLVEGLFPASSQKLTK